MTAISSSLSTGTMSDLSADRQHYSSDTFNRPSSSSSKNLPPGAPSGSRINTVTYRNATIKALIDPGLRVNDVIRQLCANAHLGVQEPPALFALRDEDDEELIDDDNMGKKIEAGRNFKLCSSPTIEAAEMVDKLSSRDEKALKIATYTLQRLIRDKPFYEEFIQRGGMEELVAVTMHLDGSNTLAYALTCIQNLIECCNEKWEVFDALFIQKVSENGSEATGRNLMLNGVTSRWSMFLFTKRGSTSAGLPQLS